MKQAPKNVQEMARVAATIKTAGELLNEHGVRALHVTDDWKPGPRSANLDPDSGGWRYDVTIDEKTGKETAWPVPNDRTGEAAMAPDPLENDHATLEALVIQAEDVCGSLVHYLRKAVPNPLTVVPPDEMTPAQISLAGWCVSCWRDHGYHEPVAMRPNGERRYRDHCLWCGEFLAANGVVPTIDLLEARHRGERISKTMVEAALAKIDKDRKDKKAARRKKKKAA